MDKKRKSPKSMISAKIWTENVARSSSTTPFVGVHHSFFFYAGADEEHDPLTVNQTNLNNKHAQKGFYRQLCATKWCYMPHMLRTSRPYISIHRSQRFVPLCVHQSRTARWFFITYIYTLDTRTSWRERGRKVTLQQSTAHDKTYVCSLFELLFPSF